MKYLVVVSYENRWQLGRLVHNMGVLRLAAIFDIELLQEASNKLRDLYETWRNKKRAGSQTTDIKEFAGELDALGSDIMFGLTFRIERSAY